MGCDVYASDLNPIACMLTWGAFNIIGASAEKRAEIETAQKEVAAAVDAEITRLGIEHDKHGNRAKAYLYCLETRCPKTGWMVPMAPSWVISKTRNVVAKLVLASFYLLGLQDLELNRLCCGKTNCKLGQEVAMPLLTADPVTVLPDQREALEHLVRTHSTPQQVALRARIILHAVEGMEVRKSARSSVSGRRRRGIRRKRWRDADGKCAVANGSPMRRDQGAGDVHARANLRGGGDDMRETVGERTPDQPMDPARNCRRGHTTPRRAEDLAALSGRFLKRGRPQAPSHPLLADFEA